MRLFTNLLNKRSFIADFSHQLSQLSTDLEFAHPSLDSVVSNAENNSYLAANIHLDWTQLRIRLARLSDHTPDEALKNNIALISGLIHRAELAYIDGLADGSLSVNSERLQQMRQLSVFFNSLVNMFEHNLDLQTQALMTGLLNYHQRHNQNSLSLSLSLQKRSRLVLLCLLFGCFSGLGVSIFGPDYSERRSVNISLASLLTLCMAFIALHLIIFNQPYRLDALVAQMAPQLNQLNEDFESARRLAV